SMRTAPADMQPTGAPTQAAAGSGAPCPDVSIVVPALDEAKVLPGFWARLSPVLNALNEAGFSAEVVLVNDGSTDDTLAVMRSLAAREGCVRVVDLARRFGHQAALVAGLDHARGKAVAVIDSDLQDPPELLVELARHWRSGNEVVYGVRRRRDGDSWFKRASAHAFYRVLSWIAGDGVRPDVGDFYLMDRKVADVLRAGRAQRPFLRGALSQAGFRHLGVPYDRSPRWAGETKYPLVSMMRLAWDAVLNMTYRPLRMAGWLGLLLVVGGAVALVPTGLDVRALVVLLAGVQLLSVGLLGEYVGRTHAIVAGRPVYLVREVIDPGMGAVGERDEEREEMASEGRR
ncbi:MAG: glycosyltransferase family 2 protein, partial [Myxococcota bacterium]